MISLQEGCALLQHTPKTEPTLYGRVLYIDPENDSIAIAKFPQKGSNGHESHYVKQPIFLRLSVVRKQLENREFSSAEYIIPSYWTYSDDELKDNSSKDLLRHTRRRIDGWIVRRDRSYELIKPFVEGKSMSDILLNPNFSGWPIERAKELKLQGPAKIYRALNTYLLGLGLKNSLLPKFSNCGAPGKQKFSERKTGRPREHDTDGDLPGANCTAEVRTIFALGWKKFKKSAVSVKQAFRKTLNEWFVKSIKWNGNIAEITLLPEALQFSEEQFEYWGTHSSEALSALQINRGETERQRAFAARQTKFADKFLSVNSDAMLDSTSCDQTLVSTASRLRVISSPWRTEVMGACVNYIFGHHVGFESASSNTALMAICHAAESKVEYCNRFGRSINEEDWLPMKFSRFLLDNGEGKSELVMKTFEDLQCGAIYGPAYSSLNKSPQESSHHKGHRDLGHLLPGSTMGRRRRRGEPSRAALARFNFEEYIEFEIERIYRHNNLEIIRPPLLSMRRDCIDGTRKSVVEWLIAHGKISSVSADYDRLKVRCLPRIDAFWDMKGIQLYDPILAGKRVVLDLIYANSWTRRESIKSRSSGKRKAVTVHMNPSDLSQCWCHLEGELRHLVLQTPDPELSKMTFVDWLYVCTDDKSNAFRARVRDTALGIKKNAEIKRAVNNANAERKKEVKALGRTVTKTEIQSNILLNTEVERSARGGIPKLSPKARTQLESQCPDASSESTIPTPNLSYGDDMVDLMNTLKST